MATNNAVNQTSQMFTVTNDLTITSGNIALSNTNGAGTQGVVTFGGSRYISNYGTNNFFLGLNSGNTTLNTTFAVSNSCLGDNSLLSLTTGGANIAFGHETLKSCTTGLNNCGVGFASMNAVTTGSWNTVVGYGGLDNLTTGSYNTAIGLNGSANNGAGSAYTTSESSNIVIGSAGVAGDNNIIRIGTDGSGNSQQNKFFVAGVRGITTGVNDAIAVLIDSAGQLGTISSSLRFKENIRDMGHESANVLHLRPVIFNYKEDPAKSDSIGLIAEEVAEVMPWLVVYDKDKAPLTVRYQDLPVILLNEMKKLKHEIAELKKELHGNK
jgi:hypothetical protein